MELDLATLNEDRAKELAAQLLYELAEMLEKVGEVARALAVCMELESEAGAFRDVAERIDRLTKVQTGG